jgi:hypothetical protein
MSGRKAYRRRSRDYTSSICCCGPQAPRWFSPHGDMAWIAYQEYPSAIRLLMLVRLVFHGPLEGAAVASLGVWICQPNSDR